MKQISIPTQTDIRNVLENELRKKQKLISVQEIRTFIKQEVMRQSKDVYKKMDKLRRKIQELELNKNLKYVKLKLPGKNEKDNETDIYHVFSVSYSNEGYCLLDMQDINCFIYEVEDGSID